MKEGMNFVANYVLYWGGRMERNIMSKQEKWKPVTLSEIKKAVI